tara:strand:+ start:7535 stop:8617 length:1083 start_codon:yes stop_codon:yes gene_type:complete
MNKKRGRKSKSLQAKFRAKNFQFHQYWNISYTERYGNGEEKDFKTFIRAKSFQSAKEILKLRLMEDDPDIKVKALQGFMFHKEYKTDHGKKLGTKEWEEIRSAAFPNPSNTLFKLFVPRPSWKSNRYNATDYEHLKKIGFQKGQENWVSKNRKGKSLALELREGKIWTGHEWIDWDKQDMERIKKRMMAALILHNNVRCKACKEIGVSRNSFQKLMKRVSGVDWAKDFPPPKPIPPRVPREQRSETQKRVMKKRQEAGYIPFAGLTEEQQKKKIRNNVATWAKRRESMLKEFIPKAKAALSKYNNSRSKAAKMLGMKPSLFSKRLNQTKDKVDWSTEYPNPHVKKLCKKTGRFVKNENDK